MDDAHFVALPMDEARAPVRAADVARLRRELESEGFVVGDAAGALEVTAADLSAEVSLDDDWTVHVRVPARSIDVVRDAVAGRAAVERLMRLAGVVCDVAQAYVGFVSTDEGDDLSFVTETPPFVLTAPLALVALGPRYLADSGVPGFAAGADLDVTVRGARVIVLSLSALA